MFDFKTTIPEVALLMQGADHIDVQTAAGGASLREFAAGMFSYQPGWMTFLYRVRGVFVRLLGMRQEGLPQGTAARREDVPLTPGETFRFLTVKAAHEDHYWVGGFDDKHLTAYVAIACEPIDAHTRRFHVMTIVHYNNWAGPVYFNVIRPFHVLIVRLAAKAGAGA